MQEIATLLEAPSVIDFCPDGYLPLLKAIATAARYWFAERFTKLENATPSRHGTEFRESD